jgi:hypothetical protein
MNRRSFVKGLATLFGTIIVAPKLLLTENIITPTIVAQEFIDVGYEGSEYMDSGMYYCPYIPLQISKVVNGTTTELINFTTRYGNII